MIKTEQQFINEVSMRHDIQRDKKWISKERNNSIRMKRIEWEREEKQLKKLDEDREKLDQRKYKWKRRQRDGNDER